MIRIVVLALIVITPVSWVAQAQEIVPIGDSYQVNEGSSSGYFLPRVAAAPDGSQLIGWGTHDEALVRGFTALGDPAGGEFVVGTSGSYVNTNYGVYNYWSSWISSVEAQPAGNFVVAWSRWSYGLYPGMPVFEDSTSVMARRFDDTGSPIGSGIQVDYASFYAGSVPSDVSEGDVAVSNDGGFIVVWKYSDGYYATDFHVLARKYSETGTPSELPFQVDTQGYGGRSPAVSPGPGTDEYLVVWESYGSSGSDDSGRSIQSRVVDSVGAGPTETQVNVTVEGDQEDPRVSLSGAPMDGLAVWMDDLNVVGRRFNEGGSGLPSGSEFLVAIGDVAYENRWPNIAADTDGSAFAVWAQSQEELPTDLWEVKGRLFDADGSPLSSEITIASMAKAPDVTSVGDGAFIVVWTDQTGVKARRYHAPYLGNQVWIDDNANGLQDDMSGGPAEVVVRLLNDSGIPVASAITNGRGIYRFTGVVSGNYTIEVPLAPGYYFSPVDAGDDAIDSDVDTSTGQTALISYVANSVNRTWDAGLTPLPTLGGHVWFDGNGDGLRDPWPDEFGSDGIEVRLLTPNGSLINSAVTAVGGRYSFDFLNTGDFVIEVVPPAGASFSPQGPIGGPDPGDSDVDPSTGRTEIIPYPFLSRDVSWDAGLVGQMPIFEDGFETGDTTFWSVTIH